MWIGKEHTYFVELNENQIKKLKANDIDFHYTDPLNKRKDKETINISLLESEYEKAVEILGRINIIYD